MMGSGECKPVFVKASGKWARGVGRKEHVRGANDLVLACWGRHNALYIHNYCMHHASPILGPTHHGVLGAHEQNYTVYHPMGPSCMALPPN